MSDSFHATIKLITGEEILAEATLMEENGYEFFVINDPIVINALYKASQAGVQIDLIVRGHCRLRPGLPGFSETIRVTSIIGRFLEHSRIYGFGNNGMPRYFIGSADWQRRNLDDRVEVIVEIRKKRLRERLQRVLDISLSDHSSAWELDSEGVYHLRRDTTQDRIHGTQQVFMNETRRLKHVSDPPWDL